MNNQAKACRSTIIPSLRYRDTLAASDWLTRAIEASMPFVPPSLSLIGEASALYLIKFDKVCIGFSANRF
jgi:hypothetical protein